MLTGHRKELLPAASRRLARYGQHALGLLKYYEHNPRWLARHYSFSWARRLSPMAAIDGNGLRYLMRTDDILGRHLYVFRDYEQSVMQAALRILEERSGRRPFLEGTTFVDVGANLGSSVIPAVKLFGAARGIAFEPAPANYDVLRCNLILNGVEDLVDAHALALSDHDGHDTLELSGDNSGDHRIRDDGRRGGGANGATNGHGALFDETTRHVISVPAARLDTFLEQGRIDAERLGLVWVDVQGHEAQVLAGAEALLAARPGLPFVIEFWPYGLRRASGLDQLCATIAGTFRTVIDVRASEQSGTAVELPAVQVSTLVEAYDGVSFTDLILIR